MALNGSGRVPSNWNSNYGLFFEWVADRKITNNESEITVTVYADFISYATISVSARPDGQIIIANQEEIVYMPAISKLNNGDAKIKLGTIKKIVKHRDDGTLPNVVLKAVWPIRATISGAYRSTIEGTFSTGEITRIPRSSEILSSVDFTLENNLKVNLKRYSDEFKHEITLKINNTVYKTVSNINTETTFTFNQTEIDNFYNIAINNSSLDTELIVITKQNSTTIGTTNKKGKMYIDPIKNAPTFTDFEFKPDSKTANATGWNNYISSDNEKSVLGHTIYTIKPGVATAKKGATITGFEIALNNRIYKASGNEFTLPNPILYNDNLIVSVVDSRGFKTRVIKGISGQQYSKITFKNLSVKRRTHPNQTEINFVVEGKIFKNAKVSNQITSRFRSKAVGSDFGSWINLTSNFITQANGAFTANFNRSTFDASKNYEIELEISDSFYTEPFKISINKEKSVFKITKDKIFVNEKEIPNSKAPAFKVYKSTGSEKYSTGDVVIFNAKSYDIDDNYDISARKFTAPKKGIYHFSCGLGVVSPTSGNRYGFYFRVNGVNQELGAYYAAGSTDALYVVMGASLLLNAGDEFDVTVKFANAKSLGTGIHITRLSGYLIREID